MSNMIESIDLSSYSIEQLNTLVAMARQEIVQKKQIRLHDIRTRMEQLADSVGMSVTEILELDGKKRTGAQSAGKIKYRNPANAEQTWSGRGQRPRWLQVALNQGARLEDFAVGR